MANDGKYVRSADTSTNIEDDNPIADEPVDQINSELSDNRSASSDSESSSSSGSETDGRDIDDNRGGAETPNPNNAPISSSSCSSSSLSVALPSLQAAHDAVEHVSNTERIERMEKMIAGINDALSRFKPNPRPTLKDHIKPFPSGIAANKMWEEWNRYLENFEIAASLSNVNNPVMRTQLLFLSMGNELQEFIEAGKLRPSLTNPDCYKTFVSNIKKYFRSMTDTAAEHEAFSRMKEEKGEAAVAFHARLTCKVRSCNYSVDDEDRFVRAQLLSGLRNRELVKQARTYGYDTNVIVQSATRDEAFETETRQLEDSSMPGVVGFCRNTNLEPKFHKKKY